MCIRDRPRHQQHNRWTTCLPLPPQPRHQQHNRWTTCLPPQPRHQQHNRRTTCLPLQPRHQQHNRWTTCLPLPPQPRHQQHSRWTTCLPPQPRHQQHNRWTICLPPYSLCLHSSLHHFLQCLSKYDTALDCYNFNVHQPILIMLSSNITEKASSQTMNYIATSPS